MEVAVGQLKQVMQHQHIAGAGGFAAQGQAHVGRGDVQVDLLLVDFPGQEAALEAPAHLRPLQALQGAGPGRANRRVALRMIKRRFGKQHHFSVVPGAQGVFQGQHLAGDARRRRDRGRAVIQGYAHA